MSPTRPRHPKKVIESAVCYAEQLGWQWKPSKGHAWGRMLCPAASRTGCIVSVWSTPKSADNHARQLRSRFDACPHTRMDDADGPADDMP